MPTLKDFMLATLLALLPVGLSAQVCDWDATATGGDLYRVMHADTLVSEHTQLYQALETATRVETEAPSDSTEVIHDSRIRVECPIPEDTVAPEDTTSEPEPDPEPVEGAVFADDFSTGGLSHTENGYGWGGIWNAEVQEGVGRNGTPGLAVIFPAQPDGSDSKSQANLDFGGELQEVWVEYWMKVPSNFLHRAQVNGSTNNKFFGIWRNRSENPKIIPEYQKINAIEDTDERASWLREGILGEPMISEFGGTYADADANPFIAPEDIGTWMQVRWHFRVGDPATDAGSVFEVWKNGTLWHRREDHPVMTNEDPALNHFTDIRFLGWSNSGFDEETTFVFDDVRIYASDPGW